MKKEGTILGEIKELKDDFKSFRLEYREDIRKRNEERSKMSTDIINNVKSLVRIDTILKICGVLIIVCGISLKIVL